MEEYVNGGVDVEDDGDGELATALREATECGDTKSDVTPANGLTIESKSFVAMASSVEGCCTEVHFANQ